MNENQLRERLQKAMPGTRKQPPSFAEVWAGAEARYRHSRRRNATLGSIAAAVVLAAVVATIAGLPPEEPPAGGDEFLMADALMNTTQWRAPSDALLPAYRDDIYGEIPLLIEATDFDEGSLL